MWVPLPLPKIKKIKIEDPFFTIIHVVKNVFLYSIFIHSISLQNTDVRVLQKTSSHYLISIFSPPPPTCLISERSRSPFHQILDPPPTGDSILHFPPHAYHYVTIRCPRQVTILHFPPHAYHYVTYTSHPMPIIM